MRVSKPYPNPPITEAVMDIKVKLPDSIKLENLAEVHNEIKKDFIYKTFTGIYVFNREKIGLFHTMCNTPLQMHEDCEQLKILEHGYKDIE